PPPLPTRRSSDLAPIAPIEAPAVAHVAERLLFVEHPGNRLLLVPALHVVGLEAVFRLVAGHPLQRDLEGVAQGRIAERLAVVRHELGVSRCSHLAQPQRVPVGRILLNVVPPHAASSRSVWHSPISIATCSSDESYCVSTLSRLPSRRWSAMACYLIYTFKAVFSFRLDACMLRRPSNVSRPTLIPRSP